MSRSKSTNIPDVVKHLRAALGGPAQADLGRSRSRVRRWFAAEAPLIQWDEMHSPLGQLFAAVSSRGICALDFGRQQSAFFERLDPLARLEKNPAAVRHVIEQLNEYFAGDRRQFHIPVDLSTLTPFHQSVLEVAREIAPGDIWTYQRVAARLGRPQCSRPVGQALARNPVPIVVPCHRVVASNGRLGGYSGGSGTEAKRWLLRLEQAL